MSILKYSVLKEGREVIGIIKHNARNDRTLSNGPFQDGV